MCTVSIKSKTVLMFALVSGLLPSAQAADKERVESGERMPASMGALGDSMTAGALAMFRRQDFVLPWTEFFVALRALRFVATKEFNSIESRKLSWASGYDTRRRVESHAFRLSQIQNLRKQLPTFNASVTGAESENVLADQVARMNEWSKKNIKKEFPDYVTLMIGPNDACADTVAEMVSTEKFYSNVSRSIDELLARSPDTKIVVGSIPNIETLRNVAKDSRVYWGFSCEKLWEKANLCPTLTTLSDPYERAIVTARIKDYNNALEEIVESHREEFGDRIRFAPKTFKEEFTANDLSIDCFHPNQAGQARIANATWDASWWTQEWKSKRLDLDKRDAKLAQERKACMARRAANPKVHVSCP